MQRVSYAGRVKQTGIYLGKCFRVFRNENGWKVFVSSFIITVLIASVTGEDMFAEYSATRNGCFTLICACIWIGIFNSIQSVCKERDIIKREHRSGLHMSSYVTAHMVFELFQSSIEAVLVTLITVFFYNDNIRAAEGFENVNYFKYYLTFFLIIYAADALGLMVSCIVKSPATAMTVMPFVLIIQLVMAGFIFKLEGRSAMIGNITVSKWGINALGTIANVNEMHLVKPETLDPADADLQKYFQIEALIEDHLDDYNPADHHLLKMWLILIAFVILYWVISTLFLEFIDRDKR